MSALGSIFGYLENFLGEGELIEVALAMLICSPKSSANSKLTKNSDGNHFPIRGRIALKQFFVSIRITFLSLPPKPAVFVLDLESGKKFQFKETCSPFSKGIGIECWQLQLEKFLE